MLVAEERDEVTVLSVLDWLAPPEEDAVVVDVTVETADPALEAVDDAPATKLSDADDALEAMEEAPLVAAAAPLDAALEIALTTDEAALLAADGATEP